MSVPSEALAGGGLDTSSIIKQLMARGKQNQTQIEDTTHQFEASQQREAQARAAQQTALQAPREQLQTTLGQAPAAPDLKPLPNVPAFPAIDPKEFGDTLSMIVGLAAIGGAFTRTPITTALNAFSQGVQGFVQGKKQVFADQMKQFQAGVEKAKGENDTIWKKYQAARDKWGSDIKGLQNEIELIAAETQSPIDMELARQGNLAKLMTLHETANNAYDKMAGKVLQVTEAAQTHADAVAARLQAEKDRLTIAAQASADRHYNADLAHQDRMARISAGGGNATQNRMQRVMAIDVDNGAYNLGRLVELSAKRGELIGASPAFANHFGGSWTADFKRYLETGAIPEDLQGADALLMNLAFDIASGQSGGSGQLAQAKIAELEKQMPLDSMPPDVKKERWQALYHRLKAINGQLPPHAQQDLSAFDPVFGAEDKTIPDSHAPKENQTAKDTDGKPIVFRGGRWEYQ